MYLWNIWICVCWYIVRSAIRIIVFVDFYFYGGFNVRNNMMIMSAFNSFGNYWPSFSPYNVLKFICSYKNECHSYNFNMFIVSNLHYWHFHIYPGSRLVLCCKTTLIANYVQIHLATQSIILWNGCNFKILFCKYYFWKMDK